MKVVWRVNLEKQSVFAPIARRDSTNRPADKLDAKAVKLAMRLIRRPHLAPVVSLVNLGKQRVFVPIVQKINFKTQKVKKNARLAKKVKHLQRQQHPVSG